MSQDFSDIHDELRAVARDLLGKTDPGTPLDWRLIAESGWLGLETPESLDGAGATFTEVAVLLEEMGRAVARGPFLGAAVLGSGVLNLLRPAPGRDRLLAETASGALVPAVALSAETELPDDPPFQLERTGSGLRLHGRASFVPDAAEADPLLLPARMPDGTPVIAAVRPDATGLDVTAQPVLDLTRRLAIVTADGVEVDEEAVWRFADNPEAAASRLFDRAAVAIACDSLGLAAAMLDATVAYAGVREQFDRPIGSFQAVKHACADMLVQVTVSRRLVSDAVRALSDDDPDAWVAASMAKAYACGAAVEVAGKAMQLHGGMGYTWESGIHLYLKRAALNRSLFGSPAAHRRRIAERYRR